MTTEPNTPKPERWKARRRHPMKFFRYRRPSWKTILGVTRAKKQLKKQLGITALLKPTRWLTNRKRQVKRQVGYESELGRAVRHGLPKPGGCLVVVGLLFACGLGGFILSIST